MRIGWILCWLRDHKIDAKADFTVAGDIHCQRCGELLSSVLAEASPSAPVHDKSFTRGCQGKTRFASHEQAENRMARMKRRPDTLHPYRCHHCKGWHLGNHRRPNEKHRPH